MTAARGSAVAALEGGVVVSVQASAGSPLRHTPIIAAIAHAALAGEPAGLRINGPEDIAAIRGLTSKPIIGLHKVHTGTRNVITPTLELARGLVEAGADIIAVDATVEALGDDFGYVRQVVAAFGLPVMADVSTFEEGVRAWEAGATLVGTTLSGYTPYSLRASTDPDLSLVDSLTASGIRTVGEGRFATPGQVSDAFMCGAYAVVVGGAITDPAAITSRFVQAALVRAHSAR